VWQTGLRGLENPERDVSTTVAESRHRLVVINLYEPERVTIQVLQHDGRLERMTEIFGAGMGLNVLREVRRTATALEVEFGPVSRRFKNRIEKEKATCLMTYSLFKGSSSEKQSSLTEVLRRFQEKLRRESGIARRARPGERSDPLFLFHLTLPKAIRELERAVETILSGSWERPVLEHAAEVASALAEACRVEGLREAAGAARSIFSLVSVSPADLRSVESSFRKKVVELLTSLKGKAGGVLSDTAS